ETALPGCNTQQQIGDHGGDQLKTNGILRASEEFAEPQMLLNPSEQQLDLPSGLVEVGNRDSGTCKVVGDEGENLPVVSLKAYPAHRDTQFGVALSDKPHLGIADDFESVAFGFPTRPPADKLVGGVGFLAGDKETAGLVEPRPPGIIAIRFVE